ncbi:MAG: signal peptidase II [Desulfovibrionaceae bacterium]
MLKRFAWALVCLAAVAAPDQITKAVVRAHFAHGESLEVIPGFFNLTYVLNKGAAFGFLNSASIDWQTGFLMAVNVVAMGFIAWLVATAPRRWGLLVTGLGLIWGGALGNLIDRARLGMVTDFLDCYAGQWHWPAFNVADIGISVGAGLALLSYLLHRHASDSL